MSLNFASKKFIKENNIKDIDKFVKELKITLRQDYDIPTKQIYSLNVNELIEKYIECRKLDEIQGAND